MSVPIQINLFYIDAGKLCVGCKIQRLLFLRKKGAFRHKGRFPKDIARRFYQRKRRQAILMADNRHDIVVAYAKLSQNLTACVRGLFNKNQR